MTAADGTAGDAERPDTDDYDLLTYGEVSARMTELIAQERGRFAELQAGGADPAVLSGLETRIGELSAGQQRYAEQAETSEAFLRKFGLTPRPRG